MNHLVRPLGMEYMYCKQRCAEIHGTGSGVRLVGLKSSSWLCCRHICAKCDNGKGNNWKKKKLFEKRGNNHGKI